MVRQPVLKFTGSGIFFKQGRMFRVKRCRELTSLSIWNLGIWNGRVTNICHQPTTRRSFRFQAGILSRSSLLLNLIQGLHEYWWLWRESTWHSGVYLLGRARFMNIIFTEGRRSGLSNLKTQAAWSVGVRFKPSEKRSLFRFSREEQRKLWGRAEAEIRRKASMKSKVFFKHSSWGSRYNKVWLKLSLAWEIFKYIAFLNKGEKHAQ